MQRPASVTLIGWLAVVMGAFITLGGALGLAMGVLSPFPPAAPTAAGAAPFRLLDNLSAHFRLLATTQLVLGPLMLVSGRAFLRLKPWARAVLELFSWSGLVYAIAFGSFSVWALLAMRPRTDITPPDPFAALFWASLGFVVISSLLFAVLPVLLIRALRGSVVRNAFAPASV